MCELNQFIEFTTVDLENDTIHKSYIRPGDVIGFKEIKGKDRVKAEVFIEPFEPYDEVQCVSVVESVEEIDKLFLDIKYL